MLYITSLKKTMRQIRKALRTLLYHLLVFLKTPLCWQANLLPKHFFLTQVCTISLDRIRLYSTSDPAPPKHSARFCFKSLEEKKMHPITSIFSEMTDDTPRSCVHNTLRDLFIHGKDFRATSQYKRMINGLSDGISLYKCQSEDDIDVYFQHLTQAYNSIKADGYKSQQELGKPSKDEIRIHITENGSLCLGSKGNHRLRMAEFLDIKQVPCNVYGVNINWILSLSRQTKLPPHQALLNWMKGQTPQDFKSSSKDV